MRGVTYTVSLQWMNRLMSSQKDDRKTLLANRLRRAEGQLTGIRRMIEEDESCVDVLMQVAAVRGALGKVAQMLLSNHLETCVTEAMRNGDRAAQLEQIEDLTDIFGRFGGMTSR